MKDDLLGRSYDALLAGAKGVLSSTCYDASGYAPCWRENLLASLPLSKIGDDYKPGAGAELRGKLRAAHSSAAIVINTFGPWRDNPAGLRVAGLVDFRSLRFEVKCPSGLAGTPPHVDLLAEGKTLLAVESKCTEWMRPKQASFSKSYDDLVSRFGWSPWFTQLRVLRKDPWRYGYVDAAQLIKHAFGLLNTYGAEREILLLYLYWEPLNHDQWPECARHREQADRLTRAVAESKVRLVTLSYHELWTTWHGPNAPAHLDWLRARYDRRVAAPPETCKALLK